MNDDDPHNQTMIQSSQQVLSTAVLLNLSETSFAGGCEGERSVPGLLTAEPQPIEPNPPNWVQTNLATKRRDQTGGLIESCTRLKT